MSKPHIFPGAPTRFESKHALPSNKTVPKSSRYRKVAFLLRSNIQNLEDYGDRLAFLTITFRGNVRLPQEVQDCLHAFHSKTFGTLGISYIKVFDHHADGRLHVHYILVLPEDYDEALVKPYDKGLDSQGEINKCFGPKRREFSVQLAKRLKAAGFGRCLLEPVRNLAGLAVYLSRKVESPAFEFPKGTRRYAISRSLKSGSANFMWLSPGANKYRAAVSQIAQCLGIKDYSEFKAILGRRWGYYLRPTISILMQLPHLAVDLFSLCRLGKHYNPALNP